MALSEAYAKHPQHTLNFDDEPAVLRVRLGDLLIAETTRGLVLREGAYPPTVYIPREDVRMELLVRSDHSTHCPFKGDASYFDLGVGANGGDTVAQIAWSYEDPFDQMLEIANQLSFYTDRVTLDQGTE